MADKPSRALVIYGDGFAPLVNQSHAGLHSLAAMGACGFLALRASPPAPPSASGLLSPPLSDPSGSVLHSIAPTSAFLGRKDLQSPSSPRSSTSCSARRSMSYLGSHFFSFQSPMIDVNSCSRIHSGFLEMFDFTGDV